MPFRPETWSGGSSRAAIVQRLYTKMLYNALRGNGVQFRKGFTNPDDGAHDCDVRLDHIQIYRNRDRVLQVLDELGWQWIDEGKGFIKIIARKGISA